MYYKLTTVKLKKRKFLYLYHYAFPKSLIAQSPACPRDCSRLLVYRRCDGALFYDTFINLPKYLPKNAVLVFNKTKVIPARLVVKKETGGRVQILYLEAKNRLLKVMADRKLTVGARLSLTQPSLTRGINFTVVAQEEKYYYLHPNFPLKNLRKILEKYGKTPIPPYIKNSPLSERELREKYQTVFAREPAAGGRATVPSSSGRGAARHILGSVAAPTASLHFTRRLFKKLRLSGVKIYFITLHVNLGTFAPVTEKNLKTRRLHEEFYEIDKKTAAALNKAKRDGHPIIAVGTTVVRALESASARNYGKNNLCGKNCARLKKLADSTDLFISPGYKFRFTNNLITNFHVPRSSLLMLVSTFVPRKKLLALYKKAIAKNFRLFSFGDGMLII